MATYINLTPHPISLNDGRVFAPSGTVARVTTILTGVVMVHYLLAPQRLVGNGVILFLISIVCNYRIN